MPTIQKEAINSLTITRPTCERCGLRMWLWKISPDGPGKEMRSFECPLCDVSTNEAERSRSN